MKVNLYDVTPKGGDNRITKDDINNYIASNVNSRVKENTKKIIEQKPSLERKEEKKESEESFEKIIQQARKDSNTVKSITNKAEEKSDQSKITAEKEKRLEEKHDSHILTSVSSSIDHVPYSHYQIEIRVTELSKYISKLNLHYYDKNLSLNMFAFYVKAISEALKKFPRFNFLWNEAKAQSILNSEINIIVKSYSNNGFTSYIIDNIDKLSIIEISKTIGLFLNNKQPVLSKKDINKSNFYIFDLHEYQGYFSSYSNINKNSICIFLNKEKIIPEWNNELSRFEPEEVVTLSLLTTSKLIDLSMILQFTSFIKSLIEDPITLLVEFSEL